MKVFENRAKLRVSKEMNDALETLNALVAPIFENAPAQDLLAVEALMNGVVSGAGSWARVRLAATRRK